MASEVRIVFTGGGTGGHVFPLLAVSEEASRLLWLRKATFSLYYIGPVSGPFDIPVGLFEQKGIAVRAIRSRSVSGERTYKISGWFEIFRGFFQTLWHLWVIMPDVIFSKGGYGAIPVLLVAMVYRIPVLIHESDSIPGKVNEFFGKYAARIAVSFESTRKFFPPHKTALTGNPTRTELAGEVDLKKAFEFFRFDKLRQSVLILGGSQGAKALNDLVLDLLPQLLSKFQVIHQCGLKNFQEVSQEADFIFRKLVQADIKSGYKLYGFLDTPNLRDAYAVADLVVSRAGSGLIFEIALLAKAAIVVPYTQASRNHQRENAYLYAQTGAAVVLEEENLKPHIFMGEVTELLADQEKLTRMQEAAKNFSRPEAALTLARELLVLSGRNFLKG